MSLTSINKREMMRKIYLLLFLATIVGAKEKFLVINQPDSLLFQGNSTMRSTDVGEILAATLGFGIQTQAEWSGLIISDPFRLPKKAVILEIIGVKNRDNFFNKLNVSYACEIEGEEISNSIDVFLKHVHRYQAERIEIEPANVMLTEVLDAKALADLEENIKLSKDSTQIEFETFIKNMRDITLEIHNFVAEPQYQIKPQILSIDIEMHPLIQSLANEPILTQKVFDLLDSTISHLQGALKNIYFVVVTDTESKSRKHRYRREAKKEKGSKKNESDSTQSAYIFFCPVEDEKALALFQLTLWSCIGWSLSLLATAYTVATIDPGMNSIIYRVTSGKTKKNL